jgi:ERCC4-type nuclease
MATDDEILSPIYLDKRIGSAELYTPLVKRSVPVELTSLEFGDACFLGYGPEDVVVVGIERKRINDLLQSLTSGRLSGHQLPGLVESYAHRWLLVEGTYRESDEGYIETPRGGRNGGWETVRLQYAALENYLTTLQLRGGLHIQRTYSITESASWLHALWCWWTKKEWREHRSHLALHQAHDYAVFFRPSLCHRMAAQLPGIDETAAIVARHLPTPLEMVNAEEHQWRAIPGIGKVKASRIYKALRSRE